MTNTASSTAGRHSRLPNPAAKVLHPSSLSTSPVVAEAAAGASLREEVGR